MSNMYMLSFKPFNQSIIFLGKEFRVQASDKEGEAVDFNDHHLGCSAVQFTVIRIMLNRCNNITTCNISYTHDMDI